MGFGISVYDPEIGCRAIKQSAQFLNVKLNAHDGRTYTPKVAGGYEILSRVNRLKGLRMEEWGNREWDKLPAPPHHSGQIDSETFWIYVDAVRCWNKLKLPSKGFELSGIGQGLVLLR